ncbi:sensor histidine kinase [Paenibacillus melissococcoides]|uniref:histidine kinase n=1 Tax=Paenibacillus melissococcoides TaxID=2912268 RepID=A0ABN8U1N1_9BACL|nr:MULTISPECIES: sensor histidine kinase [Paenibacillus]MEB9896676.1 sensor histidine kinase [Bacillus cereus]CAH8244047.1 sensor histidine kinase [Paenibacillus melissococcoides]CAH8703966.1 sensor histidine kinase [Paenibacillus melissococcoides]CAH8706608.1 sensor histidine kinase [Paenibacillus melissococcoides]GIO80827.1 sensor histidine kinase [Paenibacillus dendritiformis]
MKLFWREHLPVAGFTCVQLLLVLLVFWYDGYDRPLTAAYALFLGLFVFALYLGYRYATHRLMYKRLTDPPASLTSTIQLADAARLSRAVDETIDHQYRYYQQQLKVWERKQQEHLAFMNQWVHQMKTPLSVIELITQDAEDPKLASISEEADQMKRGLEMVLYMARLDTFEHDFHVEKQSLRDIVHDVVHENKRYFIRSYVYPDIQIDPELTVETDVKWLRFVLQQIVTNAIKYSAGSRTKVTATAYTEGRAVVLEVKDRGAGIPKQDVKRVFQPFFTGENGRKYKESTGMGLYLAKEIIGKLHHEIELESEESQGTAVRIVFPFAST